MKTVKFKDRTIRELAEMICGDFSAEHLFLYRKSSMITEFFSDCDTDYCHDGSTRSYWVSDVLRKILSEPHLNAQTPPETFSRVILQLMNKRDAINDDKERLRALAFLNKTLAEEGFEAFYAPDNKCLLHHIDSNTIATSVSNKRPLSVDERLRQKQLITYLDRASEDELIVEVLIPLFKHLGFSRVTATGHEDKALEYGKDIWMKYKMPTHNVLYFGIQVKKGKLNAAAKTNSSHANIAEIYNQVLMMANKTIFDPGTNKKVLVDHVFIISGGEITKQAQNWLGEKLDDTQRRQILFMDRNNILDLFSETNLSLPAGAYLQVEVDG